MLEIKRLEGDKFSFHFAEGNHEKKTIHLSKQPDKGREVRILTTYEDTFEIEVPCDGFRPYFTVEEPQKIYVAAERTLPVDGMNNFRDMGGYETWDGYSVKWGKLYRSDHIHNATAEGLKYLRKLGIHTIVDYRSTDEIGKYPNGFISDDVNTYCLDPDAHTAELAAQFTSSKDNEDENLVKKIILEKEKGLLTDRYSIVMEQYHNFVHKDKSKEAFQKMLKVASRPESAAMVQHCRGGKDRTGFGSMLLLGVLGVKQEYLVQDYMLTHYNRIKRNRVKMNIYKRYTDDSVVLEYLYSLIDTKPEFILKSYESIMEEYGSIEGYVQKELDFSAEEIKKIKELYLE